MLTVSQFAKKIGHSRQWVHQLIRERRITPAPRKVGHYFLLHRNARILRA